MICQKAARCSIDQRCSAATPSTPTARASRRTLLSPGSPAGRSIAGNHAGGGGSSGARPAYAAAKQSRCTANGMRVNGSGSRSASRTIRCQRRSPVGSVRQRSMRSANAAAPAAPSGSGAARIEARSPVCASIPRRWSLSHRRSRGKPHTPGRAPVARRLRAAPHGGTLFGAWHEGEP